ncbi:hypothetical protein HYFRA_00010903 [Hymenoscyphus fraxineus]|uniref:TOG domain-containing protein n=1 Tax=Hymenoscyphus fraxineus TaxID=746836 RepID=A0A9N9KXT3_9HELO|nr:hypothetical protein HYFRA_00010903 [Hymenoscyphus fraxineus]
MAEKSEKITEEQVAALQAILRSDAIIDTKVAHITSAKSVIKRNNVPEVCIVPLFEAVRTAMASQHAQIVQAGFSTLSNLLERLSRQEPKYVVKEAGRTLPLVIDKLGDPKEKYRSLAATCLTTFWKVAPLEVERIVKNAGLVGKNPRMKEASMAWVVEMHQTNGMAFKSFVTTLMDLLEDADGMVRDAARVAVITLFQNAPNGAKSDLKKQLKNFNVRPAIVSTITTAIEQGISAEVEEPAEAPARPHLKASTARPATPVLDAKVEHVDPAYVNTARELDETLKDMHPCFEGKESEQNWLAREKSCTKIRRLNAGNAPQDYRDVFLVGIKSLLDGILKAVNSLRTSLSKEGCSLIQEVTRTNGSGMDPMVEILLQNLIKLCGGTKKISSQNGNITVDIIIGKVTFNARIMQHIWLACQDKNVQPRTYATGWLKTLLKKEAHHRSQLEHGGSLDLIEKCLKKGLADANAAVRENMRSTYWAFAQIWPARAEAIMATLEPTQQRLLENAPDNPNSPKKPEVAARPGLGFSKSTNGPPKPSVRDTILAQRKAALANKQPARPTSAMASLSPVRHVSNPKSHVSDAPVRGRPERPESNATVPHSGLSVAPMRPSKRPGPRPEMAARPATAGPYSVRRHGHTNSNDATSSPTNVKTVKGRAPSVAAPKETTPKRMPPRPNTSHSSHTTNSHHVSPPRSTKSTNSTKSGVGKTASSPILPRSSPPKASPKPRLLTTKTIGSSPVGNDENITLVVPKLSGLRETHPKPSPTDSSDEEQLSTPSKGLKVYEDPFSSEGDQTTPRPLMTAPVLEEVAINEDAANLMKSPVTAIEPVKAPDMSPERFKQNSRLLDSGINKIKSKSLDVHGFRKLQGMIRDNKAAWSEDKFDVLLLGLFEYLESSLENLAPEKVLDVKAQILATIRVMYKKERANFEPHIAKGLDSILTARSAYDSRIHIVSGLELLANDLITLAPPKDTLTAVTTRLLNESESMTTESCRVLSLGLCILKELLEVKEQFMPSENAVNEIGRLAARCIESTESGVRLDAVLLCVGVHARVGDARFWRALEEVADGTKSLVTYYIVKRQRELES